MEDIMNKKKVLWALSLLIIGAMLLTACKGAATEAPVVDEPVVDEPVVDEPVVDEPVVDEPVVDEPVVEVPTKVQFCTMYSTSITDNGWDVSGHESFMRFQQNPGADIEVLDLKWVEGFWGGPDAVAAMKGYAEGGCDIIWGHGGYFAEQFEVAPLYLDVMFVGVGSGYAGGENNDYHYMNRCHDGSYLMGVLAGLMTEADVIGIVGGYPGEDVNDNIHGFMEGARTIKPELKLSVSFIQSWYDPTLAGEYAEAMKAAGADMLYMLAENFDVCGEGQGAMCFAPYIDWSQLYPGAVMASFYTTWDAAYEWALQEWLAAKASGEWNGGLLGFENWMASGACEIILGEGIEETLPADVLAEYRRVEAGIMDGSIVPTLNIEVPVSD